MVRLPHWFRTGFLLYTGFPDEDTNSGDRYQLQIAAVIDAASQANADGDGLRHSSCKDGDLLPKYSKDGRPPAKKHKKCQPAKPTGSGQRLRSRAKSEGKGTRNGFEEHDMPPPQNYFEAITDGGFTKLVKMIDLTGEFVSCL
jgi:hypothetical protein